MENLHCIYILVFTTLCNATIKHCISLFGCVVTRCTLRMEVYTYCSNNKFFLHPFPQAIVIYFNYSTFTILLLISTRRYLILYNNNISRRLKSRKCPAFTNSGKKFFFWKSLPSSSKYVIAFSNILAIIMSFESWLKKKSAMSTIDVFWPVYVHDLTRSCIKWSLVKLVSLDISRI